MGKSGNPARKDPDIDKLFRTMKANVELVRDIGPRLSPEMLVHLKASALGMMWVYSELTGLPAPDQVMGKVY